MALHENLKPFENLIGVWRGPGKGFYPTIKDFDYTDQWEFTDIGKPFLLVTEKTWIGENAMHTETGYLRRAGETVEIVMAIPTGQSELGVGTWEFDGEALAIDTDAEVRNAPTAKTVDRLVRRYRLEGDELRYELDMAAVGQELTGHLVSVMTRVS